ncbi:SDR family oxidoreductase [Kumtagia ephedrae]|uniref:NAD(P)-dependent oxidoreductase n=1 Tax=Kumtagia ephedrae TaxID=2116701 RepID=A0A2P7S4P0_9HYPH|nr:SDR family oxidoreductase [Mesorhizobium ephedrae]PSJ57446.1 NAD(P)-dependent oxidoreductase [Mesorhizobium ephedrae]
MRIGVSGASGKLGGAIVEELQERGAGHDLVAISRSPDKITGVEARAGDYDQPDTLLQAYSGLDRLIIIPSADMRPGVRGVQLKAAIDAAVKAGVGHIYLTSAAGTRQAAVPTVGESYWTGEQHLIRNASRWTILRMNYYAESMVDEILSSQGQGVLAGLGDERVAFVSRDDLAAAAAGALLTDGHAGAIYNATGPAVISGTERAAIASEILGRPLGWIVIGPDQLRHGLTQAGLPAEIIDAIVEIKTTFVQGYFDVLTTDVQRLSGRAPKSLREALTSRQA